MKKLNLLTVTLSLILLLSGCSSNNAPVTEPLPSESRTMKLSDKDSSDYYFSGYVKLHNYDDKVSYYGDITDEKHISQIWEFITDIENQDPIQFDNDDSVGDSDWNYLTLIDKHTGNQYKISEGIYYESPYDAGGASIYTFNNVPSGNKSYTCYNQTKIYNGYILESLLLECLVPESDAEEIFGKASPETSALEFYTYDGNTIQKRLLFDIIHTNKILDLLSSERINPIKNRFSENISYPIHGIRIMKGNGDPLEALWTGDGILFTNNGMTYESSVDFSDWAEKYRFEPPVEATEILSLPCADFLLRTETSWNFELLPEAETLPAPDYVSIEDVYVKGDTIYLKFYNSKVNSSPENYDNDCWMHGEDYAIQAEHNGKWYTIPTASDKNYTFKATAYYIGPLTLSDEYSYSTRMYGKLPDGHYRLSTYGMTLEFDVSDNNIIL